MSTLTLNLDKKSYQVTFDGSGFIEKIIFSGNLPNGKTLVLDKTERISKFYVEFNIQKPSYETEVLSVSDSLIDADSGSRYPASVSFYAVLERDIFEKIRTTPHAMQSKLRIDTPFMGALRFEDLMGDELVWESSIAKTIPVESYEIIISQPENED